MKTFLVIALVLALCGSQRSVAQLPQWQWARQGYGNEFDHLSAVCADANGDVIVVGYFASDSIRFGTTILQNSARGFDDAFVAKYSSSGALLWAHAIGGSGDDKAMCAACDSSGNVYICGYYYSPFIVVGADTLRNAGTVGDLFLIKYNQDGALMWSRRDGGAALEIPYGLAVDREGNVVGTGRTSSTTMTFGTTKLLLAGANDAYIVKYDSSAAVLWAISVGGGSIDEGYAIGVDPDDNIYIGGHFNQTATFGTLSSKSAGSSDGFLLQLRPAGQVQWVARVGGSADDRINSLCFDAQGNCIVGGFFKNASLVIGSDTLRSGFNDGVSSGFIAQFSKQGTALWARSIGAKSTVYGLCSDGSAVYSCGGFDDDSLVYAGRTLHGSGSGDFFVLRTDFSGNARWCLNQSSGATSSETAYSLSPSRDGSIFVAGDFGTKGSVGFESDLLTPTNKSFDVFVAKLTATPTWIQPEPLIPPSTVQPMPCDQSFVLHLSTAQQSAQLFDNLGECINSRELSVSDLVLEYNTAYLPTGMYTLVLHSAQGVGHLRVIVQH